LPAGRIELRAEVVGSRAPFVRSSLHARRHTGCARSHSRGRHETICSDYDALTCTLCDLVGALQRSWALGAASWQVETRLVLG